MKAYIVLFCANLIKTQLQKHPINTPVKGAQSRRAFIFTHLGRPVSCGRVCGGSLWSQGVGTQSWVLRMLRRAVSKSCSGDQK